MNERRGTKQELAAARAGVSVKTAHKYERAGRLPSQLKQPRTWRTRPNSFEDDWPWVVEQLQRAMKGISPKTLMVRLRELEEAGILTKKSF